METKKIIINDLTHKETHEYVGWYDQFKVSTVGKLIENMKSDLICDSTFIKDLEKYDLNDECRYHVRSDNSDNPGREFLEILIRKRDGEYNFVDHFFRTEFLRKSNDEND